MAVISGTAGNDNLRGTANADTINGNNGNDTIDPGRGSNHVNGGAGADILIWNADANATGRVSTYIGGSTAERYDSNIYSSLSGGDRLHLGTSGTQGFRVRFQSNEDGFATDGFGNRLNFTGIERLQTGAGDDWINAAGSGIKAARGIGDAESFVPKHGITVFSGAGNDYIHGGPQGDVLDGGPGNDTIYGGNGGDLLMPSAGNDYGHAGPGDDNVRWGNHGSMVTINDIGHDTLFGGAGHDLLNMWATSAYENSIGVVVNFTSTTAGTATFAPANGTLVFSQFEQFWTHEGKDTVSAANAKIGANGVGLHINTRWGDDILTGSRGNDTLEGGEGADTITGGAGNDLISMNGDIFERGLVTPDVQRDVLILRDGFGVDTIRAFQAGDYRDGSGNIARHSDFLNVSGLHDAQGNLVDVNDVRVTSQNGNAVLSFPNGERLILEGVNAGSLNTAMLNKLGIPTSTGQQASKAATQSAAAQNNDASHEKGAVASQAKLVVDHDASDHDGAGNAPLLHQVGEVAAAVADGHSGARDLSDLISAYRQHAAHDAGDQGDVHALAAMDGLHFNW